VAYYNWLKTHAVIAVGEQSLRHAQAARSDAEARLEAGFGSRRDLLALDAQVARARASLAELHAVRDLAAASLAVIMGDERADYVVGEDVLAASTSFGPHESVDALVDEAMGQRAELQALDANARSADQAVRATRARYYPRLDAIANANYANPNQRYFPQRDEWNADWRVGVTLTWVLNEALDARAQIDELRASQHRFEAQRDALARAIELEVRQAWADHTAARAKIEHGAQARRAADEAYRVARDVFAAGDGTVTDVLQAEAQRVDASLGEIHAKIDLRIADAKLRYATGRSDT
jgi:outer membrane protein TolC